MDEQFENVVVEHNHNDDGTSSVTVSGGPEGFGCLITHLIVGMIPEEHLTVIVDGETDGIDTFEAA
jgi:hypothetical protein